MERDFVVKMRPYGMPDPYHQAVCKYKRKRKRWLTIAISSTILVVVIVCAAIGISARDKAKSHETNNDNLQSACQATSYPQTCESTLAHKDGSNSGNPLIIAKISLEVAREHIQDAYDLVVNFTTSPTNDVNTTAALDDCRANLDAAIARLEFSLTQASHVSLQSLTTDLYSDLNTWISSALTFQTTCMDSFEEIRSSISEKINSTGTYNSEILSNALAIIDWVYSLYHIPSAPARRLLSLSDPKFGSEEEYPSWVSRQQRRLMSKRKKPRVPVHNVIVAQDGSGQFKSINAALANATTHSLKPYIIYIKSGWYDEIVTVSSSLTNVVFVGDGIGKTIITGSRNVLQGVTTFQTATLAIEGFNFMAKFLTIKNYAGPAKYQAVALRVSADYAVFYRCSIEGYQDTLYSHTDRQFYRECTITGTVDFIFGNSQAVFQVCTLVGLVGIPGQQITFTAQGRTSNLTRTGLSFHQSTLTGSADLMKQLTLYPAYLGRPWKMYSTTVFTYCILTSVVHPAGWLPWNGTQFLSNVFYGEYLNEGAGSPMGHRVTWSKVLTLSQAQSYSVNSFIQGKSWINSTGVPYQGTIP